MSMPQELINIILFKWGGLSINEELKEEIVEGCVEYWMNWNYLTKGEEWLDLDEEWDEEEYKQFDNDIDKRILENIK